MAKAGEGPGAGGPAAAGASVLKAQDGPECAGADPAGLDRADPDPAAWDAAGAAPVDPDPAGRDPEAPDAAGAVAWAAAWESAAAGGRTPNHRLRVC